METHEISKTAFLVAAYRARATNSDTTICYDPWASRLAGDVGFQLSEWYDGVVPDCELWISLRTRHIDDCIRSAIECGARQVVVLGAGLDTRAARLAHEGVRFFEVDRPASQAAKRSGLKALDGYPVDAATFVECDFNEHCFIERLVDAGFDPAVPACFVLEGVLYYLPEDRVRDTLGKIAAFSAPDSCVVFDLFNVDKPTDPNEEPDRFNVAGAKEELDGLGEQILFGVEDPTALLADCGYRYTRSTTFASLALMHTGEYDPALGFHEQRVTVASRGRRLH
ncbi:MAG: SAM-dependent methyltransferase [Myxococcota bacterium]